jgi:hypothetical protein
MLEINDKRYWDLHFTIENGYLYLDGVDGDIEPYACTEELHDILVDFLNMGIDNTLYKPVESYSPDTQLKKNIMAELKALSLAKSTHDEDDNANHLYAPTIIYGMVAEKLIAAIRKELDK